MKDIDREQLLRDYGVKESDVMMEENGREYFMKETEDEDGVHLDKVYIVDFRN